MARGKSISVHGVTPAEASIMDAIDSIVGSLKKEETVKIDFDFLRDYTIAQLQKFFMLAGERAYTALACQCVGASRYVYRDRKIAMLRYKKMHDGGNLPQQMSR